MWTGCIPCSFHVDWMHSILIPCGLDAFHVESMWNPCGHSMWTPCGHSTIPCGIWIFHDHSIWSPCGVHVEWRPQNEWDVSQNVFHMEWWNPCGLNVESTWNEVHSMWSLCGVHVECGGRVKTSVLCKYLQ